MTESKRIKIHDENDIVTAREIARSIAMEMSFSVIDQVRITTITSELARNIFAYAEGGFIKVTSIDEERVGIRITARDTGPGIRDVELAMRDNYSTTNGLGMGLPGIKRLSDEFEIESSLDKGTTVRVTKWLKSK